MSRLFEPLTIRQMKLKNRIVMSPMCMYSCMNQDGMITDFHKVHYASRALGQAGLIILEATSVSPEGRISAEDLGIWDDAHVAGLRETTGLMHQFGAMAGIQLAHAGRKAEYGGEKLAPSAIPFPDMAVPKEMSAQDIRDTVRRFAEAAAHAKDANMDCIEIHAAHGYLIHEFLSPLSNRRTDEYGGSEEGRFRFLREVVEAVRAVWDRALFVRVSASDYHPEGLDVRDHVIFAGKLKELGVDLIDCSSGGLVPAHISIFPGYQVPFAEVIRREAGIPTGAVGLITEPLHAEEVIGNGRADLVLLARELLRDPFWPRLAARKLGAKIEAPRQYERGWGV